MSAPATLLLHRGARRVSPEALAAMVPPSPTQTWYPIAHHRVLDSVLGIVGQAGLQVRRMDLGVSGDGHRFFGVLDLHSTILDGVSLAVGVRNSTDKSLPAGIALGERVLVCDNLAFSAQIVVMRKHTRRIEAELDQRIQQGIDKLEAFREDSVRRITRWQQTPLTDGQVHDLLIRAVDARCIGLRDVPRVLREWRVPSHEAFQERNVWSLHNAFTEVAKPHFRHNPAQAAGRTLRLHHLLTGGLN